MKKKNSFNKSLLKEKEQISQIAKALNKTETSTIFVGRGLAENVSYVEEIPGTPKGDCTLMDNEGYILATISLKSADDPTQMQQWGGVSSYATHSEVREFIEDLKFLQKDIPEGRITKAYFRPIEDMWLAFVMCYGDGSDVFNDCDMIIASRKSIKIASGQFSATNIFYAPQIPRGEWKPTLWATYRHGRGVGLGLLNIRVGVYPQGWGKSREHSLLPSRLGVIR